MEGPTQEGNEHKPMVDRQVRNPVVSHHSQETELLGCIDDSANNEGDTKVGPEDLAPVTCIEDFSFWVKVCTTPTKIISAC